jgi:exosortase
MISLPYLIGLAGLSFAVCYAAVLVSLVALWSTYPLYSYGYAVPLIAGWLCWTKYRNSPPIQIKPDYLIGIPLMLAAMSLLIIGNVGSVVTVTQTSLIVALAGLILVLFGRETFMFYGFPFAYLLFMVPIWDVGLNPLQDPSRLISARIAEGFLHFTNVPILRHDTTLVLPSVTLSVMPQCSGVNQFVALMAMVVPASYVFLDSNRRRLLLVAFAVIVGYVWWAGLQ